MRLVIVLVIVALACFIGVAVGLPLAEDKGVNSLAEAEGLLEVDGQGHENESERKIRQFGLGGFGGGPFGGGFGGGPFGGFGGGPFGGGYGRGFGGGFGRGGFGHGGFGGPFGGGFYG